ncbi:MAG: hypothetical protein HUU20_09510 [Pirellulales bacterium]|nr:hypothetical protein [Pirellulales bacterium]
MLQQVHQFRSLGEDFAMQHKDSEYLGQMEEELLTTVLASIPAERRLRGLSPKERLQGLAPEERLQGLAPEERLRGLSPEELAAGLSDEQAVELRDLLERKHGH